MNKKVSNNSAYVALAVSVLLLLSFSVSAQTWKANTSQHSENPRSESIEASQKQKASVASLLSLQEAEAKKAEADLEQLRQLVAEGLVARVELSEKEESLATMHSNLEATRKQIANIDQALDQLQRDEVSERQVPQAPTKSKALTAPTILRHGGIGSWSKEMLAPVRQFFVSTFGKPLPTSAIGQSDTHDRLGWDHRNAVDIPLHPDSPEGKTLIDYLRSQGMPFLAFRAAITGVSTGPHIHIGLPSHRLAG